MSELLNIKNYSLDEAVFSSPGQGESINLDGLSVAALQVELEDTTPANKTFDNGTSEVVTLTFPAVAASTGGDYFVVYDTAGLGWAAALNKSGSDPAPTGAVWAAIAAGRKVNVDISGGTDAASVAALVETAFDALVGNPFVTDDSAANGTMLVTCTLHGNTTAPERHNANDSGNGSMGVATTTPGTASEVDVTDNEVTIPSHGFATGLACTLTTTGTLPAGLATATTYYLIVVDANTVKFASSLANALAGTAINITDEGSSAGVNTVAVTALSAELYVVMSVDGEVWFAASSPQAVGSETEFIFTLTPPIPWGRYLALYADVASGQITVNQKVLGKGIV